MYSLIYLINHFIVASKPFFQHQVPYLPITCGHPLSTPTALTGHLFSTITEGTWHQYGH